MKKALAVLAAAFAVYVWGFLFWGATTIPYGVLKTAADDAAAQQAIREHFPRNGVYALPSVTHDAATLESLSVAGPTAFVFVTAADGRPAMVPSIMIFGFLHEIVVAAMVAALLSWAGAGLGFGGKVKLALLAGAISVVMTQFGDAIWWMFSWDWKLITSFYEIVCFLIMGLILAKMLPARS
jgi:hypothetical protein